MGTVLNGFPSFPSTTVNKVSYSLVSASGTLLAMLTSKLFMNNQQLSGLPSKVKSSLRHFKSMSNCVCHKLQSLLMRY